MSKKSTSKKTKSTAGKAKKEPIIAQDLINAAKAIFEASTARWKLTQKQLMPSLAPEKFWDKKTIKAMRKQHGKNFHKADQIMRELVMVNLRIEGMRYLLEGLNTKLGRTLEREKELAKKLQALDLPHRSKSA